MSLTLHALQSGFYAGRGSSIYRGIASTLPFVKAVYQSEGAISASAVASGALSPYAAAAIGVVGAVSLAKDIYGWVK